MLDTHVIVIFLFYSLVLLFFGAHPGFALLPVAVAQPMILIRHAGPSGGSWREVWINELVVLAAGAFLLLGLWWRGVSG